MMVRAVVPPTVPEGTSRVRVCLHASNTELEINELVRSMELWVLEKTRDAAEVAENHDRFVATARL